MRKFDSAIKTHENGHKTNAIRIVNELATHFATLPSEADCLQLERLIQSTGDLANADVKKVDVEYDQRTNHGETQGTFIK